MQPVPLISFICLPASPKLCWAAIWSYRYSMSNIRHCMITTMRNRWQGTKILEVEKKPLDSNDTKMRYTLSIMLLPDPSKRSRLSQASCTKSRINFLQDNTVSNCQRHQQAISLHTWGANQDFWKAMIARSKEEARLYTPLDSGLQWIVNLRWICSRMLGHCPVSFWLSLSWLTAAQASTRNVDTSQSNYYVKCFMEVWNQTRFPMAATLKPKFIDVNATWSCSSLRHNHQKNHAWDERLETKLGSSNIRRRKE